MRTAIRMDPFGLSGVSGRLDALLETMRAFAEAATDSQTLLDTVTERVTRLMVTAARFT